MSRVLIITYDLLTPGKNYEPLLQVLKSFGPWAKLGGSSYLVVTEQDPAVLRDRLTATIDSNDKLYVGVAPAPSAWAGMPNEVSNWILANQK